jgi:hypothetical protein
MMALLFLSFVSMLSARAHKLETVSEEEEKKGNKTNQGNKMKKKQTPGKNDQNKPLVMFKSHEDKSHMASLPRTSCNPFSP